MRMRTISALFRCLDTPVKFGFQKIDKTQQTPVCGYLQVALFYFFHSNSWLGHKIIKMTSAPYLENNPNGKFSFGYAFQRNTNREIF